MSFSEKLDQKSGLISHREIDSIYSKGTFNDLAKESYEPQFVMALAHNWTNNKDNIGVCYFDISTFKCYIG